MPKADGQFTAPIIFSQTEIEAVGLHAEGRLRLLDSFVRGRATIGEAEAQATALASSFTSEIAEVLDQIATLTEQLNELPSVDASLSEHAQKEAELTASSTAAAEKKKQLDVFSERLANSAVRHDHVERFRDLTVRWSETLSTEIHDDEIEPWTGPAPDPLGEMRPAFVRALRRLRAVYTEVREIAEQADTTLVSIASDRTVIEQNARQLRREIETIQQGAGAIVRQGAALRERKAQLTALQDLLKRQRAKLASLRKKRGEQLERLEQLRQQRFDLRNTAASGLTKSLGPRVQVEAVRSGIFTNYADLITAALRGSGLKYNEIVPQLAQRVSPRELVEAAESNDFELLADVAEINRDRAARILAQLREVSLGELATALVEDSVNLRLLDGQDFKDASELSTGQRCTVVLPIVLEHHDRVLIVDQPEDHIDNAFIVDTIIRAVNNRTPTSQLIFTTHNANVPVLGNADLVVQMDSDGRRGFVRIAEALDHPDAVEAITTVMEGGAKAFSQRAKFYAQFHNV